MLTDIIIKKIRAQGPISFRDFMEMALYYPGLGYYTSSKEKIGRQGDFYTSPSYSPIFGQLIGNQVTEMFDLVDENDFTLVEYGAGPGFLCRDILDHLDNFPRFRNKIRYCIIEKSPAMIEAARKNVPADVCWYDSISKVPGASGCVLSNELVDNFAVHRVIMQGELKEIFVDHENGFREVLMPASAELRDYLAELKIELPEGFCTEINLEAKTWMQEVAQGLKKGFVITIDYGYPASELFYEYRKKGSLACYYKHRKSDQPYAHIGEQDITAHVNFSALCLWGYKSGLEYCGFTNQCNFLLSLGFYEQLKKHAVPGQDYLNFKTERALTNSLLSGMGHTFKVLIQQKEMKGHALKGLRMTHAA